MFMYYVYAHYKADDPNGLPFYIGKGKNQRDLSQTRNQFWKNISTKHGFVSKRLHENLTEQEAWDIETALIEQYGKLSEGTGCLCNLSNGGEGASGVVHSVETKQKWSNAKKGKTWEEIYGIEQANKMREDRKKIKRVHSVETREKMSASKKGENNPMFAKTFSDEHKEKLSEARIGKPSPTKGIKHSDKARQNYAKAAKIRVARADIYKKVSSKLTGITRSEETKKKMSSAAKAREALKKLNKGKI